MTFITELRTWHHSKSEIARIVGYDPQTITNLSFGKIRQRPGRGEEVLAGNAVEGRQQGQRHDADFPGQAVSRPDDRVQAEVETAQPFDLIGDYQDDPELLERALQLSEDIEAAHEEIRQLCEDLDLSDRPIGT